MIRIVAWLVMVGALPIATSTTASEAEVIGVEQPIGMGMVRPVSNPGGTLYLYGQPDLDQLPDAVQPRDSLVFGAGPNSPLLTSAPPWFAPDVMKLDYGLLYLRAVTVSHDWIEVLVTNPEHRTRWNPETLWVARDAVDYVPWPDFLLSIHSVEVIDQAGNPVRLHASDEAGILAHATLPLQPIAVQGSWLLVSTNGLADRIPPYGWIRWRVGETLLIRYNLLS